MPFGIRAGCLAQACNCACNAELPALHRHPVSSALHPALSPSRDSVEGSEADLLLGGSPRSDRTFMSTRDKVGLGQGKLQRGLASAVRVRGGTPTCSLLWVCRALHSRPGAAPACQPHPRGC